MSITLHLAVALAICSFGFGLVQGCGSKAPKGVAEVPECRDAARAIKESKFDTGIDHLRRQADAYSECMTAHGYVLDEEQLDERLNHVRQVENAKWLGGDPYYIIAERRQQFRMSPQFWRPAPPPGSGQRPDIGWNVRIALLPSIVKSRGHAPLGCRSGMSCTMSRNDLAPQLKSL
ncbi:MAG TPA: hypothetical protein VK466_05370 [Terriglobales bacterium]|nr:hypothetical protein [Terriglobales bacterium]